MVIRNRLLTAKKRDFPLHLNFNRSSFRAFYLDSIGRDLPVERHAEWRVESTRATDEK